MSTRKESAPQSVRVFFFSPPFVSWHAMCFPGSNLETVSFWETLGSWAIACISSLQLQSGLWAGREQGLFLRKALGFVRFERFSTSCRDGGRGRSCCDTSGRRTPCRSCDLHQQTLSWGGFRWPSGMRHIINVFLFSIVPEWKNTLQALNFLKMSMFSWIILQFSMVQKNVNVATFGSGNMAVAANPSKVFNPTVVFACATPDLAETTQFLATVFGTTTESPRIRIHRRPHLQPSFKGDITVLILEKAQNLNHFSPQYLAIR